MERSMPYTVSMKLFCTLLNTTVPTSIKATMTTKLYASQPQPTNEPQPRKPYLKAYTMPVRGLRLMMKCSLGLVMALRG
jgi:hypothetical protein